MKTTLREDADRIIKESIAAVMPDAAVRKTLAGREFGDGRVVLVSTGKAGWQMAKAAYEVLGDRIDEGIVVTKYDHAQGSIGNFKIFEAGHPVPDENSFRGTQAALDLVSDLSEGDTVLFLLSGGGSALFEKPLIQPGELSRLTEELLACGADIRSMNTIRKRMSAVKGGRFAKVCEPAKVLAIVLSDIVGDPLDMIASGPAYPDSSTSEEAKEIAARYKLTLTGDMERLLSEETPKELNNVETHINGSVRQLVSAAARSAESLGYRPVILTDCMECEAREAGSFLASVARSHQDAAEDLAFLAGGETVVHLKGKGKGGRNQELALAGAIGIAGLAHTVIFSVGSDGTDGPTDAAGGYAEGGTFSGVLLPQDEPSSEALPSGGEAPAGAQFHGVTIAQARKALEENDAYSLLKKTGGLIMTGPTGTNVNDVSVVLIRNGKEVTR